MADLEHTIPPLECKNTEEVIVWQIEFLGKSTEDCETHSTASPGELQINDDAMDSNSIQNADAEDSVKFETVEMKEEQIDDQIRDVDIIEIKDETEDEEIGNPIEIVRIEDDEIDFDVAIKVNDISKSDHMSTRQMERVSVDKEKPFKSNCCPATFNYKSTFQLHQKKHNKKRYKCTHCQATYAVRSNLLVHLAKHAELQLATDRQSHVDKLPLNRSNQTAASLFPSEKYPIIENKQWKCMQCQSVFSIQSDLLVHQATHDEQQLVTHQQSCTDDNSLNCNQSSLSVPSKQRPITKNTQYKCMHCPAIFAIKSNMLSHQSEHVEQQLVPRKRNRVANESLQSSPVASIQHPIIENKQWKCSHCPAIFAIKSNFLLHQAEQHLITHEQSHDDDNSLNCNQSSLPLLCQQYSPVKKKQRLSVKKKQHKCMHCPATFAWKSNMLIHQSKHDEQQSITYQQIHDGDNPSSSNKSSSSFPSERHPTHENKQYKCNKCSLTFDHNYKLFIHRQIHNGEKWFKCSQCPATFTTQHYLMKHRKRHTGEFSFKCKMCSLTFSYKSHLYTHERKVHNNKKQTKYKCNECSSYFSSKHFFAIHQRSHAGEKPYKCDECAAAYYSKDGLKKHLKRHIRGIPLKCNKCTDVCETRADLQKHMQTHVGQKAFKCNQCEQSFVYKSNFDTHLEKSHAIEKQQHICQHCGTECATRKTLQNHEQKRHRHKCKQCSVFFVSSHDINEHLRTSHVHDVTAEKDQPFKCSQCSLSFAFKYYLVSHRKIHESK